MERNSILSFLFARKPAALHPVAGGSHRGSRGDAAAIGEMIFDLALCWIVDL
jgi:hypothetical protein